MGILGIWIRNLCGPPWWLVTLWDSCGFAGFFSWISLLGRIPPSVLWVSWVLSVIGISSWEIRNLGSRPSSLLVDPALSLSLAQLGTSALSLLHTKRKTMCVVSAFLRDLLPPWVPSPNSLLWDQVLLTSFVCVLGCLP